MVKCQERSLAIKEHGGRQSVETQGGKVMRSSSFRCAPAVFPRNLLSSIKLAGRGSRRWGGVWLLALLMSAALGGRARAQMAPDANAGSGGGPAESAVATPAVVTPTVQPRTGKYDVTRIGERGIGNGLNLYSLEKERGLGRRLAEEVEGQSRLISDPVITEYVNRVGQSIVRNSDAHVPFTIKVIDDDEVNAFALPGGYFYVDSGLILAAETESELAGVMAHEIAHVAARHATKNATRAQLFNLASIPLIFVGGPIGYAVRQVAGLAVPMSFLKFNRDAEREADLLGLEYEYAAGYDPQSFVQFFEKLDAHEKEKRSFIAKAFSTHPMNNDRIKRAQKEIEALLPARGQYVVDTSEFQEMKERLAKLENMRRPEEGGVPQLRRRGPESNKKDGGGPVLRKPPKQ
ncbi:MAG TPA: M48 family metallopeptidase [Terriglobales bacterium]|nr:M48 family metallopeptidase [Terriglobales bacterium]